MNLSKMGVKNGGARNSSVELFRIVSMLLVLIAHFNGWLVGGISDIHDSSVGLDQRIGQTVIQSFALVCVNCFVIISGWFGLKFSFMRAWKMWAILVCLYIPLDILSLFVCNDAHLTTLIVDLFAFNPGRSYFIIDYMLLMFFSPALNLFVDKYKERVLLYALALWGIEFVLESIFNCPNVFVNNGYSLFHFILMYLLTRSLSFHYDKLKKFSRCKWLMAYVASSLATGLLSLTPYKHTWGYSNPLAMVGSLALFFFFLSFTFSNKKINWIASSSFSVFILHSTSPFFQACCHIDKYLLVNYSYGVYLLLITVVVILVFSICIVYDKVRIYVFSPYFDRLGNQLNKKLGKYFIYDS